MTSIANPTSSNGMNSSPKKAIDIIQMSRVLLVSTVDLCAAEACLVIATPVALKAEIEQMIPRD